MIPKAFLFARLSDNLNNLRIDSGATIEYQRGMLVATYGILIGIYSNKHTEKLISDYLPQYIYKGVIPGEWTMFRDIYEESHTENDGRVVLKKK